jgi:hypothetical protein
VRCCPKTDGTGRKKLATLTNAEVITSSVYFDKYFACAYYMSFDDYGDSLEKRICAVSVIDIESGEVYTTPNYEDYQGIIRNLTFDGNSLVFSFSYTTENIDFSKQDDDDFQSYIDSISKCDIIKLDISQHTSETVLSENASCADIGFGYALLDKDSPVLFDLNTCEEKTLDEKYLSSVMTDKGALLYNNDTATFALYDIATGKISELAKIDNMAVSAISDSYIYILYNQNSETLLGVIDKDDYLNGKDVEIKNLRTL